MKSKFPARLVRAGSGRLAIALAALLAAHAAHATSATWSGSDSSLWATSNNWSGAPAIVPGAGDTATFNSAGNGNTLVDLGAGVTIQQVTFDTTGAAAYTLGSGGAGSQTLTFNGGGITLNNNVANNQTVNANLVLGTAAGNQTYTFTNNITGNSLTLAGGISSTTTGTKTVAVAGAGATGISGALTNGSGTLALSKAGAGVLTLAGSNDFTGSIAIGSSGSDGGTIRCGANDVLPDAAILNMAGSIDLNGHSDTVNGATTAIYFIATNGPLASRSSTLATGAGTLTLGGNIAADSNARQAMTISGKLYLSGTRTIQNHTYGAPGTGNERVPITITADIAGDGGTGLSFVRGNDGGATVGGILSGNNSYTGTTTLNNAAIEAGSSTALGNGGNITFTGGGGAILRYTANSAGTDWSTRFKSSNQAIRLDTNGQTVALAGIIDSSNTAGLTKLGVGTLVLSGPNTYTGSTTVNAGTLQSGANDVLPNASAVVVSGNAAGVTATLDLNGNSDTLGSLNFGGATASSGAAVTTGAGTLTLNGNVTYDATNSPLGATLGGNLALGSATRTFTVGDSPTAASDLTVGAAITGGAGVGLTKSGAGTLVLSGTNSYGGNTTVSASGGVLRFDTPGSIAGSGRNITVNSGGAVALGYVPATTLQDDLLGRIVSASGGAVALTANTNENLDFSSGGPGNNFSALALGAIGNITYSGAFTPYGTTYRLGGGGGTLTLANPVSGAGNTLIVNGNVTLTTSSDFTGTTTINSGILQVSQGATTNVVNNGTILFDHSDSQNYTGTISGSGGLTKAGSGQLTLSVPQTYSGTTTLNAGTLVLAGGNHTLNVNKALVINGGTLNLGTNNQYAGTLSGSGGSITGSGGRLTLNPTTGQSFAGAIQGSVSFVKVGSQALTLTGNATTSGMLSVLGGGLTLKDGGMFSATTGITLSGGSLTLDNTGTTNINGRVNSANVSLDGGTLNYRGANSTALTETLGAVTATAGLSAINITPGSSGSAVLTLASLSRTAGAMVVLNNEIANLGVSGNNPRLMLSGGLAALTGNLTPVNGVVPGLFLSWGAGGSRAMAGYDDTLGFVPVPTVAGSPASTGTQNVTGGGWAVPSGGQSVNSIINSGNSFTFANPNDVLTLTSGMFFSGQDPVTIFGDAAGNRGVLTTGAGQQELFVIKTAQGSGPTYGVLINSVVADNGSPVRFVTASPYGTDVRWYTWLTANNTYTGGTVVNGSLGLKLGATSAGMVTIPYSSGNGDGGAHGLVIDNSTVTMVTNAGQIDPRNTVTLNGAATLNLTGANNTLAGLVFNSNGGAVTPTVTGGTKLTLTGNITSTPTNVAVTPTISVTLDLDGTTSHDITVAALPEGTIVNSQTQLNGLTISSVIQNGGFTKKGGGILNLTATNTYAGDTTVKEGMLSVTKAYLADASSVTIGTESGDNAVLKLDHNLTDTVARLYIDGVQMPAGTYGSSASAATYRDNATFAGTGMLNVTIGTPVTDPYLLWAQTNITDKNPTANATPGGDPDSDGSNNLAEFAFNGDPLSGTGHGKVYVLTADSEDAGSAKELILTVAVRADTPAFSAATSPTATSALDGITYTIEGSTTLGGFPTKVNVLTTALPPAEDPTPGTGYVYRSFSLEGSNGLTGKGFLRAKVTRP